MAQRIIDRFKFWLELQIQRGAFPQLLLMATLIIIVAVWGGLAAWMLTPVFQYPTEAIWWAFLRLTDPGYLGDDEGYILRVISTIVTVLGYVLFMGSLIAIMTQWLNRTIRVLESGFTPISMKNHFLILGWTNRTPSIVRELALSEGRVQRFLRGRGTKRLRIVILAENVSAEMRQELREIIGRKEQKSQIILRSGSSMRIEQLGRVDFMRASAIILPGADYELGGPEGMDSRVIKTLMSISKYRQLQSDSNSPVIVAEIFDAHKARIAEEAYQGSINVISGDAFISRLMAQNVRNRGLSHVYSELLSHTKGNEVYVRRWPQLAGKLFAKIGVLFPKALVLGVVRTEDDRFKTILNPPGAFTLLPEDRLIMVTCSYEDATPTPFEPAADTNLDQQTALVLPTIPLRRILLLGWNHKAAALIQEFASYPNERFAVDVMSMVPVEERVSDLKRILVPEDQVAIRQIVGDYTFEVELLKVDPGSYHNILFLGVDWLDSSEESDARTILGYMLLHSILSKDKNSPEILPEILVELKDPANERLFRQRTGEVIISPVILSHMLAHAALRQELTSVFNELFGPGGAEIFFRSAANYDLVGQEVAFREIQHKAALYGEIALGVREDNNQEGSESGIFLNPSREKKWQINKTDEIVVLARYS